jgi:hypothetical protein
VWAHLEQLRESGGKKHEHYNLYYNNVKYSGILLPPAAALFPTLWPHFFLRWSCPSPVSTGGCLPVGWIHGGELELEAHALAQSFSSLQNVSILHDYIFSFISHCNFFCLFVLSVGAQSMSALLFSQIHC